MNLVHEFIAWLDSLFGFRPNAKTASLQASKASTAGQDTTVGDIIGAGKTAAALVPVLATGGAAVAGALGIGGAATGVAAAGTAAEVVPAAAATIAAPGAVPAAVAAAPVAAVAASAILVAGVAALLTTNVVMMFQSLFGDATPPEPQRRAAYNTQIGAMVNSPYLAGKLPPPPTVANADDVQQVQAATIWLYNAREMLRNYGRANDFTYLAQQSLLASADVGPSQSQEAANLSGTIDLRREF